MLNRRLYPVYGTQNVARQPIPANSDGLVGHAVSVRQNLTIEKTHQKSFSSWLINRIQTLSNQNLQQNQQVDLSSANVMPLVDSNESSIVKIEANLPSDNFS